MIERVHYSTLKRMALSPKAYRYAAKEDAAHLRRGTAVHALVYRDKEVIKYDGVRNGKAWEAFKAANQFRIIANEREYAEAVAISSAVMFSPCVQRMGLLDRQNAVVEREILWDFNGVPFSSTPDLHCRKHLVDLKTTKFAQPAFFQREILKYHYHVQSALYRRAVEQKYGYLPENSYIIAVESKPPYDVVVFRATPKLLELGERTACLWLEQLRGCQASNHWPGYSDAVIDVEVPDYMLDEEEESEEDE